MLLQLAEVSTVQYTMNIQCSGSKLIYSNIHVCIFPIEMLYRRLGKLQALLSCTATLDKAKPEKKAAVSFC